MDLLEYLNNTGSEYTLDFLGDSSKNLNIFVQGGYTQARQVLRFSDEIINSLKKFNLQKAIISYSRMTSPVILCVEMHPSYYQDFREPEVQKEEGKMKSNLIQIPSLYINCEITNNFMPYIDEILENPEWNIGISRIRDNAQVICSKKHALQMGVEGQKAVRIRTHEYWLSESLEELQRKYRQESGNIFEHEIITSNYVIKYDLSAPWVKMNVSYRLFDDGFGNIYRVGRTLNVEDIVRPSVVN